MKVFLSYHFPDEPFVRRVSYYLKKQPNLVPYFWADNRTGTDWLEQLNKELSASTALVLFKGSEPGLGQTQRDEWHAAEKLNRVWVNLPHAPEQGLEGASAIKIEVATTDAAGALACAQQIVRSLGRTWVPDDGLPTGYPFEYEKAVIEAYTRGDVNAKKIEEGCPEEWPQVEKYEAKIQNPVPETAIGNYRPPEAKVIVDARAPSLDAGIEDRRECNLTEHSITFPEAGPRKLVRFPRGAGLTIGLLVSGGIAPGINSVIEGIVSRHTLYERAENERRRGLRRAPYSLRIFGYAEGFEALLWPGNNFTILTEEQVRGKAHLGGSLSGTSRASAFLDPDPETRERCMKDILNRLDGHGVEILYIIGGDGSMRAAHAIWTAAEREGRDLSVVAIPKSTDNDILWVWQSFGFLSAVNKAVEAILALNTEIRANPRLCIIQLFGSDSGFVSSHAAQASGAGVCDAALIPEVPFSMKKLSTYMCGRLEERYVPGVGGQRPYGMIVMAETAIPTDVEDYKDDPSVGLDEEEREAIDDFARHKRRVRGQTPDALRTGGLKVVSRVLQRDIQKMDDPYWRKFRVFTNEPRHLIRAIPPSVSDVIFGQRLGVLAVDNAMAGYTDFMVSQWLTEYVLVPLRLVVLGRKRVPQEGIFWKSVLAMTGQPSEMA